MPIDHKHLVQNLYQGLFHREPTPDDQEHWVLKLDAGLTVNEIVDLFIQSNEFANVRKTVRNLFVAPGHFYSPIVNVDEVRETLVNTQPVTSLPAINISKDAHRV